MYNNWCKSLLAHRVFRIIITYFCRAGIFECLQEILYEYCSPEAEEVHGEVIFPGVAVGANDSGNKVNGDGYGIIKAREHSLCTFHLTAWADGCLV